MREKPITVKIYDTDEFDEELLKRAVKVLEGKEELIEVEEVDKEVDEK